MCPLTHSLTTTRHLWAIRFSLSVPLTVNKTQTTEVFPPITQIPYLYLLDTVKWTQNLQTTAFSPIPVLPSVILSNRNWRPSREQLTARKGSKLSRWPQFSWGCRKGAASDLPCVRHCGDTSHHAHWILTPVIQVREHRPHFADEETEVDVQQVSKLEYEVGYLALRWTYSPLCLVHCQFTFGLTINSGFLHFRKCFCLDDRLHCSLLHCSPEAMSFLKTRSQDSGGLATRDFVTSRIKKCS